MINKVNITNALLSGLGMHPECLEAHLGINQAEIIRASRGEKQLPLPLEKRLTCALSLLDSFAQDMAKQYRNLFDEDLQVIIAVPTDSQCTRYNIPTSDLFFTTLIGKILSHLGHDVWVDILDLRFQELSDERLTAKALTWVQAFPILDPPKAFANA